MTTETHARKDTPIGSIMTEDPLTVSHALKLSDAQDRMYANNVRHLVVTGEDGSLVGILSTRDAGLAASVGQPDALTVGEAMVRNPYACARDTPLLAVAEEMEAHRYGAVVVTDGAKPVGIFTTTDAMHALRESLVGEPLKPLVEAQHVLAEGERDKVEHHVRASDRLKSRGGAPSASTGRLGRF
ncbi:MAG: CBS domain-containing protein [Myxococcales bacterium FL481]|nr:MAG: CBS domain-containing protein [Myxococcales bacterium FL481]